jgi:hypothetical protein
MEATSGLQLHNQRAAMGIERLSNGQFDQSAVPG